jgi:hypothetical protein
VAGFGAAAGFCAGAGWAGACAGGCCARATDPPVTRSIAATAGKRSRRTGGADAIGLGQIIENLFVAVLRRCGAR